MEPSSDASSCDAPTKLWSDDTPDLPPSVESDEESCSEQPAKPKRLTITSSATSNATPGHTHVEILDDRNPQRVFSESADFLLPAKAKSWWQCCACWRNPMPEDQRFLGWNESTPEARKEAAEMRRERAKARVDCAYPGCENKCTLEQCKLIGDAYYFYCDHSPGFKRKRGHGELPKSLEGRFSKYGFITAEILIASGYEMKQNDWLKGDLDSTSMWEKPTNSTWKLPKPKPQEKPFLSFTCSYPGCMENCMYLKDKFIPKESEASLAQRQCKMIGDALFFLHDHGKFGKRKSHEELPRGSCKEYIDEQVLNDSCKKNGDKIFRKVPNAQIGKSVWIWEEGATPKDFVATPLAPVSLRRRLSESA